MTTPYPEPGGQEFTSGHSGTDTSRDRAVRERDNGVTAYRQAEVLYLLDNLAVHYGMTVKDVLSERPDWHHGQASSALSNLHKAGRIARLRSKRQGCHVYVTLDNVAGRDTESFGRNPAKATAVLTEEERASLRNVQSLLENRGEDTPEVWSMWPNRDVQRVAEALDRLTGD